MTGTDPAARPARDATRDRLAEREAELERTAGALLAKLDAARPALRNLCLLGQVHGLPYSGPTWGDEMEALRDALGGPSRREPDHG